MIYVKNLFLGRGFVVAASILEGDYLEKYPYIEPVRSVSIFTMHGSSCGFG
jgi:hypothetical protein